MRWTRCQRIIRARRPTGPSDFEDAGLLLDGAGLRVAELPGGEFWFVDDPRARKLVTPEPIASLGPLDRN